MKTMMVKGDDPGGGGVVVESVETDPGDERMTW